MPQTLRNLGFTLVELLVVIGILSMLFVVLLGAIASGQETADEFACKANLQNVFAAVKNYEAKKGKYPPGGGTRFLWNLWRSLEPTERHRDMFLCPEVRKELARPEIMEVPVRELWRTADEFTGEMTDYAARASEHRKGMMKGSQAIVADDNEGGSNHRAGTVNVLYGDGTVKQLRRDDLINLEMWDEDDEDYYLLVGPESPHPDLKKLSKN